MTPEEIMNRYARAWVAIHARNSADMTAQQAMDAFYLLPRPPYSLREWAGARGLIDGEDEPPQSVIKEAGIEEGPGWAIATGPDAQAKIEARITALAAQADKWNKASGVENVSK